MLPVLTAAQTAALDRETEARGTPVPALMERAGHAAAGAAVRLTGGAYGRRAVVVCGKGNNGGDGLVAARHLARAGLGVDVFLLDEPSTLRGAPAAMLEHLRRSGVTPANLSRLDRSLAWADVAVDAIFGTGFRGRAEGRHARAIEALTASDAAVVAVDIPSGVEGDSGAVHGPAVRADVTVTFGGPKLGTLLFPGAAHAGHVEVVDIGFPPDLLLSDVMLVEREDVRGIWPRRAPETHKRRSGVVLVVAGSRRMPGAPRLIAEGAYRAGAGLITVAAPRSALGVVHASVAEATSVPLPEGPAGALAAAAWDELSARIDSFDALAVGPGLSTDQETPGLVHRLVRESPVPLVIDADAINAFAGRPGDLGDRRSPAVLTPHTGEFARLFAMPVEEVVGDRVGLTRKAAAETGCVVLLKGTHTVIATPDGDVRITTTGTPVLATGGTGDVLTGVIAALLGRGLDAFDAAAAGAYVHGLAGRLAGERTGEGTLSGEVARAVPEAVRSLRAPA
jgi:ADP-dependent NAD(P)H-hydrate dehydratase / NAD(P)H-hydrate epimerase